jgi:hypothetical protein
MEIIDPRLCYYRVFDVGFEIDLDHAEEMLKSDSTTSRFKLRKKNQAIVLNDPPLEVNLEEWEYEFPDHSYLVQAQAKIWSFGAVSLQFRFHMGEKCTFTDLIKLASFSEESPSLHIKAKEYVRSILQRISPAVEDKDLWDQYEDYQIYLCSEVKTKENEKILDNEKLYNLILVETEEQLDKKITQVIRQSALQYGQDDLLLVDWNSAFLIEPTSSNDTTDVIEFALCQLLEMRYYDHFLDEKLARIYKEVSESKKSIFSKDFDKLAQDSILQYIEVSETVEKVENTIKVVGDYFYAQVYRLALEKFRLREWQGTVDGKLKNLSEVSSLLHTQISDKRGHFLELVIIILIAIEMIPLLIEFKNWAFG